MKSEKDIKKHMRYLFHSIDKDDAKQLRELNIRISELAWVLDKDKPYHKEWLLTNAETKWFYILTGCAISVVISFHLPLYENNGWDLFFLYTGALIMFFMARFLAKPNKPPS